MPFGSDCMSNERPHVRSFLNGLRRKESHFQSSNAKGFGIREKKQRMRSNHLGNRFASAMPSVHINSNEKWTLIFDIP
jgi:hypothetical protein